MAAGDDAAGVDDLLYRWGAIGHDGAQKVDAGAYTLQPRARPEVPDGTTFLNVNADAVVRLGPPPVGAHSDIFHPELARLVLSAAGIGGRQRPPGTAEPVGAEAEKA
jgi:hypothetical protein